MGTYLRVHSNKSRASQHYGIEGFKDSSQSSPHDNERREFLRQLNFLFFQSVRKGHEGGNNQRIFLAKMIRKILSQNDLKNTFKMTRKSFQNYSKIISKWLEKSFPKMTRKIISQNDSKNHLPKWFEKSFPKMTRKIIEKKSVIFANI